VAVKVTDWPKPLGFSDEVTVVVVAMVALAGPAHRAVADSATPVSRAALSTVARARPRMR